MCLRLWVENYSIMFYPMKDTLFEKTFELAGQPEVDMGLQALFGTVHLNVFRPSKNCLVDMKD